MFGCFSRRLNGQLSGKSLSSRLPRGFTLIELLVVVAVITVLIAILMPSLNQARSYAKQTACLSNLRQVGTAMMVQAHEHQQYVQVSGYIHGVAGTPAGLSDTSMMRYAYYKDGTQLRPMPLAAALAPQLGQQIRTDSLANLRADIDNGIVRKIFMCPSDAKPLQGITVKASGWTGPAMWSSYGFNEPFLGWSNDGDGSGVVGFNYLRGNITAVKNPAQTLFLCDSLVRNGSGGWLDYYSHYAPATLGQAFYNENGTGDKAMFDQSRHLGRINILFVDGHGETQPLPTVDSVYSANGLLNKVFLVDAP